MWKTSASMKGFSKHLWISSFCHFNIYSNQGIIVFLVPYLHAFLLEIVISVGDLKHALLARTLVQDSLIHYYVFCKPQS